MNEEPRVTRDLAVAHGMTPEEYDRASGALGRTPSYTELGIFSVMWSEHCSYKSSRVHLKRLPTEGPRLIQGPGENAGIVEIGEGIAAVFKMESHNHPSYVEPYQGAATGVGGILRDIFTMGARPIASLNSLRFGALDHPRTRYLVSGVVSGIAGYGNSIGVPTVGGEIYFHPSYNGNILVNVFSLGIIRRDKIHRGIASGPGNPVIYVGSKTGRDGIHGASLLASSEFDTTSESKRPTVQVGDPFTEKLLLEACLEVMKAPGLVVGIQDMGAAGLTCSTVEMAARAGTGMEIDLDKVPLREEGMTPYEIMLSESQERMLLVATGQTEAKVREVFHKWDLDASVVGRVTETGRVRIHFKGRTVADVPADALVEDAPRYRRPSARPAWQDGLADLALGSIKDLSEGTQALQTLSTSLNLCSREEVYSEYDHMVRSNTVVRPGSDAAVIRLKGTRYALALTVDCNARYCHLDPAAGARLAVAEAARNLACAGAVPIGTTDCLNFGNPERPEVMWQFEQAIDGIADACRAFDAPIVGGNVSFYNETEGKGIHPTPTIAMVGFLVDVKGAITQWFKKEGDLVLLLGGAEGTLGGSEYLALLHGIEAGRPHPVDLGKERALHDLVRTARDAGLVASAHDCSEGGLAVALLESCITGPNGAVGATISLEGKGRLDEILFGEAPTRIVVTTPPDCRARLEHAAAAAGVPVQSIGRVGGQRLTIAASGSPVVDLETVPARAAWREALAIHLQG
ncbi:MAG TPA: phosphoribosylformylglycinamidine synthase subunit PurL [Candidatus Polarisedimenticolia bacterium]|jgi:phosphoribosylformylglycinamidine synthase|nr:phosphoribosylformylglycinamidine synthase subunit PurL [Candidatus Polarisedimenticolia bacterium]